MLGVLSTVARLLLLTKISEAVMSAPPFSAIVTPANYETLYERVINSTIEYVFLYPMTNVTQTATARIEIESNANHSRPLIVVVRQDRGILSWQIPLLVESTHSDTLTYNRTSRTLCATKYYRNHLASSEEFVAVSISTASRHNILFTLKLKEDPDFYLSSGEKRVVKISPSEPIYYGYTFPESADHRAVVVHVVSDNDVCITVSIQNTTCPVFDLERNVEFSGNWQTVSGQGGITVPRAAFPSGFFVVLVVKADDTDCTGVPSMKHPRTKTVSVTINPSITEKDYIIAITIGMSVFLSFCIAYIIGIVVTKINEGRKIRKEVLASRDSEDTDGYCPSTSTAEVEGPSQLMSVAMDSSLDEDDIDIMEDALVDKEVVRTKIVLSVSDLARKDPRILRHKSRLYLYYLGTVAIFYTLPVVQLVITYQNVLHTTGNQDMCYYNFLCAHPIGFLSDANHVFSNCGYILLGLLFVFLTYSREHNKLEKKRNECHGIPQHFGLFYAMGFALIMEGILSASYHVCPNRSNFQFDTSFMYIIAVLCMIKIYQTRHPDINARAPVTFGVLALIILLGLIGVLNGSLCFWIIFTIMHLLTCLILTAQIYYMGRWKFNRGSFNRIIQTYKNDFGSGVRNLFRLLYPTRFIMLVLANCCNVALVVFGTTYREKNFATLLLAILMSNLILYTLFYIVMKLCHRERILIRPLIYILLAMLFWSAALYFFINKTISWAVTPAQSRLYNRPCELLNFFDSHDIWHFLSALAMFFSFMVLLTLDDDLIDEHRSKIPVF